MALLIIARHLFFACQPFNSYVVIPRNAVEVLAFGWFWA
jgi:hypothetical protein